MHENEVATCIVDAAFQIHQRLGPGLLEAVYQAILEYELIKRGLHVESQAAIPVDWDGLRLEVGFRADLVVQKCVVVELKSTEGISPVHRKQLLTYLKLSGCRLGLLINFNSALIKDGIIRVVNNLIE